MKTKLIFVCALILLVFSCSSAPTVNEGAKLFNEQKYTKAIQVFEKVLEKDPKNADALYNIAISYIQLKDDDNALIYLNKTVEINPFQDDAWYNLALIYFKKEDYLSALGAALDARPDAKNIENDSRAKLQEKGIEIPPRYKIMVMGQGKLKRRTIYENIEKFNKEYEKCYLDQINDINPFRSNSVLEGKFDVSFVISSKNGAASKVGVSRGNKGNMYNGKVEKCVVDIIKKIKFPVPKGGKSVLVFYPFVFKHPEGDK